MNINFESNNGKENKDRITLGVLFSIIYFIFIIFY